MSDRTDSEYDSYSRVLMKQFLDKYIPFFYDAFKAEIYKFKFASGQFVAVPGDLTCGEISECP